MGHTQETKDKISSSSKGKPLSELAKANRKAMLGLHHSDETKQKMSESGKARMAKLRQEKVLLEVVTAKSQDNGCLIPEHPR